MRLGHLITGIGYLLVALCCGAWLLFGWSGSGWRALAIPTGSMRPDIPPGSMVFVHRVPTSSLKVGDVITYTNPLKPSSTISHRIIKEYKIGGHVPGFVTKGDANPSADVPIPAGAVEGKVVWHAPYAGWALLDAKKPMVILPIVYFAGLLIMIEEAQRLAEYYRRIVLYRVPEFKRKLQHKHGAARRAGLIPLLTSGFVLIGAAAGPSVLAQLRTNTVALTANKIAVAPVHQCLGGHGSNTITINNTTTQTATSGSATSTGGGNATSGNASNSSSTTIDLHVSNC